MRAAPSREGRRRARRALVAEDDAEMRRLLASVLARDGYEVLEARDGSELLDFVRLSMLDRSMEGLLDVVISDVRMPGCSGLEALAGLRDLGCGVPVILITAFGNEDVHRQARDLGAVAVFDKPFDMDDLRTVVLNVAPPQEFPRDIPRLPRPMRVFLAEDDPELRTLLAAVLRKDGFAVVEAGSGSQLVETLADGLIDPAASGRADIIVSDVRMPGWSGMEVLSGLRKAGWQTAVILMTAFGDDETHRKARDLGVTAFFDKPFDIEDFRTVVLYVALRILSKQPRGGSHA